MAIGTVLFSILSAASELAAKGFLSEISKGTGKATFEALKSRLVDVLGLKSIALLDQAKDNDELKAAIQNDLKMPAVEDDKEVRELAIKLQALLAEIPPSDAAAYAIDIDEIRAGENLLFEEIDGGIKSKIASAEGNMTFKGVTAPTAGKS